MKYFLGVILTVLLIPLYVFGSCYFDDKCRVAPEPIAQVKEEIKQEPIVLNQTVITDTEFTWIVPDNSKSVTIRLMEPNGKLIDEYKITNYITILPKQKVKIISK